MYQKTILDNGLTLLTSKLKSTQSVTVLVLVGAGSRYENEKIRGISHFLEHLFFKGAKKYQNAAEVAFAVDSVGGEFNAFTGKEYAGYYIKVAATHTDLAMDVLSDMMIHSKFAQKEIEKERGVIIEEYNMYQDTPMYQSGWDFENLLFGEQPLGWDQIGTKEIILSLNQDDFMTYKNKLYTADNAIISVSGNINESEIITMVNKYFKFSKSKKAYEFSPLSELKSPSRIKLRHKKTEQTHLVLGTPGYPAEHPDNFTMKLLSIILGGNMSSRMFLNIREAKGLSYYIQTNTDDYLDAGIISTRAGVDNKRVDEAIKCILDEYQKIIDEGKLKDKEIRKAKEYLKGKIILSLEDSQEVAHLYGKQALLYSKIKDIDDILREIENITAADLSRVAKDLLQLHKMRLVIIGPFEEEERFMKLIS
jgi:predicted Zn-dependent peptidase